MKIIKHDFHVHTSLSLCADKEAFADGYIKIAKDIGLQKIGFSDHFWDENIETENSWYQKQNFEHVSELKPQIEKLRNEGVEIFWGCETEYNFQKRSVAITEEVAEKFDYVLVPNSHTHITMPKELYEPYEKHAEYMINAYEDIINSNVSKYITAIVHPFEAVCCPYDNSILIDMIDDDTFKRLFDKTAEKDIAIEINTSSMREKTHSEIEALSKIRLFRLAKECGCKFIFGSDAHNYTAHEYYSDADFAAELLELKEKDIADIAR